jgi:hypothetical protein
LVQVTAGRRRAAALSWTLVCALLALFGGWIALGAPAPVPPSPAAPSAHALASGTPVRVQIDRLGDQWIEGRVITAPLGCTRVRLADAERRAGAYSVPLQSVRELQRTDAPGQWTPLPVAPLLAGEPPGCTA